MATSSSQPIANEQWVAALKAGHTDTTAALRAHLRQGLGAAMGDRADVRDVDLDDFTQEAIIRVLERLDSFRGDSRFTTWAMAVAVRVALTALRRRRFKAESLDDAVHQVASADNSGASGENVGARGELFAALRVAIAEELTPRQRQVLLAELQGVPQVVLADHLSVSAGAVHKTSHDARKKLKAALTRKGYDAQTVLEVLDESS